MALTQYVVSPVAAGAAGSLYQTSQDLGTLIGPSIGTGPPTGTQIYGFVDGENRAKFFYSSASNTIALPTLVAPNIIPTNFIQLGGASSVIYGLQQTGSDYGPATTGIGVIYFAVSYAAGSPDAASPGQFTVDGQLILITTSLLYEGI